MPEPEPPVVVVTPMHPEPEPVSPAGQTGVSDPYSEAEQETGTTFTSPLHPQDPDRHEPATGLPAGVKPDELTSVMHPQESAAPPSTVVLPGSGTVLHP